MEVTKRFLEYMFVAFVSMWFGYYIGIQEKEPPDVEEWYHIVHPIDTLHISARWIIIRDGNNNYFRGPNKN